MSSAHTPGPVLMHRARMACEAIALGPFTPLVLERYAFIGGEMGVRLGYPGETSEGRRCIVWSHAVIAKAEGANHE